jgi:hypothetical protein
MLAFGIAAAPAAADTPSTNPVRPNPDQQVLTAHPTHLAARAAPGPTVQPNPDQQPAIPAAQTTGPHSEVIDNGGYGPPQPPATIVRVTTPGGFDWGDAGIGAGVGLGLSIIAIAGVLAISQHRTRRTPGPADATN